MKMLEYNSCENFIKNLYNYTHFSGKSLALILSSEYQPMNIKESLLAVNPEIEINELSLENTEEPVLNRLIEKHEICVIFLNHICSIEAINKNKLLSKKINALFNNYNKKLIGFTDLNGMFNEVFQTPPERLKSLNESIIKLGRTSEEMTVKSSHGTDLVISTKTCKKWASILGFGDSDDHTPSEVATFTSDVSGNFFFRGMILCQIPLALKHGFIDDPIKIIIKKGKIISLDCHNKELKKDMMQFLSFHTDHRIVREIGIGTNEGISHLPSISASFIERHPGIHLGLGGALPGSFHLDLISCDSVIHFDKKKIFEKKFFI